MIWISEVNGEDIIFQFFTKELPEEIPRPKEAKTVNIQYPGGHQTNQIFGVFDQPVSWSGTFYGTYTVNGNVITAKDRSNQLLELTGRPLKIGFPSVGQGGKVPGVDEGLSIKNTEYTGGTVGIYIIKKVTPRERGLLRVDYEIELVPHQRAEKIKPTETTTIGIKPRASAVSANAKKVGEVNTAKAQEASKKNAAVAEKMEEQPKSLTGRYQANKKIDKGQ